MNKILSLIKSNVKTNIKLAKTLLKSLNLVISQSLLKDTIKDAINISVNYEDNSSKNESDYLSISYSFLGHELLDVGFCIFEYETEVFDYINGCEDHADYIYEYDDKIQKSTFNEQDARQLNLIKYYQSEHNTAIDLALSIFSNIN